MPLEIREDTFALYDYAGDVKIEFEYGKADFLSELYSLNGENPGEDLYISLGPLGDDTEGEIEIVLGDDDLDIVLLVRDLRGVFMKAIKEDDPLLPLEEIKSFLESLLASINDREAAR